MLLSLHLSNGTVPYVDTSDNWGNRLIITCIYKARNDQLVQCKHQCIRSSEINNMVFENFHYCYFGVRTVRNFAARNVVLSRKPRYCEILEN